MYVCAYQKFAEMKKEIASKTLLSHRIQIFDFLQPSARLPSHA